MKLALSCIAYAAFAAADDWNRTLVMEGLKLYTTEVEDHEPMEMELHGSIPQWLKGTLFRNGPGKFDVKPGGQHVKSVFDGYAYVHRFNVDGQQQKVVYSGRFLQTPRYQQLLKRGDMSYQGPIIMGTEPERKENPIPVDAHGVDMGGEMSVAFIKLGANKSNEHLLAVGEMPYGTEFDPETLETIQGTDKGSYFQYDDSLAELGPGCAHPITLPNGDMISKTSTIPTSAFGVRSDYNIFRIKAGTAKRELIATYSQYGLNLVYAHSFGLASERYAILPFWPLSLSKIGVMTNPNLYPNMQWDNDKVTKLVVLDLETGKATEFSTTETFFGFHFFNSWVETSEGKQYLVADLTTQPDVSTFDHLGLDALRSGDAIDNQDIAGTLKRIRIPLDSAVQTLPATSEHSYSTLGVSGELQGKRVAKEVATVTTLSSCRIEVPRINPDYFWNSGYQFVYGWHATREANMPNAIAKVNVVDGSQTLWTEPLDTYGVFVGEPIFVPAPDATAEDDGVIVASGLHIRSQRGFFIVLDAKTMKELARSYVSSHLPFGFHATWLGSEDSSSELIV